MQSTFSNSNKIHVGIIMDGNGRWATQRGLPRVAGHKVGVEAVRRVVKAAPKHDIGTLTLYAFSSDNWKRPAPEVSALFRLLLVYLAKETRQCVKNGVRLSAVGRRDRLDPQVRAALERTESLTSNGNNLHVRIALDYSGRDAILAAANRLKHRETIDRDDFTRELGRAMNPAGDAPDVDLVIRSGGEQRLSDFLLWECAYAELFFTRRMWPDFGETDLVEALDFFRGRERRFGAVHAAAGPLFETEEPRLVA